MFMLTEGAVDKIMNGIDVEKPVLQVLGHKKLASSSSGERYRLLVSDGKRINSFTMLATQLNSMVTDNILTEFSICQINRYAISMVNNGGKQRRVMVILNLEVKHSGSEVGGKIGNPTNVESGGDSESDSKPAQQSSERATSVARQQPTMQKHNTSVTSDIATTPIAALSPYQNRWVIKVRIANKSSIRTWSNSRGEGKLFSMDLMDESGEIRCTAFKEQCDKFYDKIEIGKVYYISRCQLKAANKQFNHLKNDYEMTLTGDSEIIPCHEEVDDIPNVQFNFSPITRIESLERNELIDVLGVVKSVADMQAITSRASGRQMTKRDIEIVDESNTKIVVTLWGGDADKFDGSNHPVLAMKGARVGEFNGEKNLSIISTTIMQLDPDIPEAHRLRGWYNSIGCNEDAKSLSRIAGGGGGPGVWACFKEAKDMGMTAVNPVIFLVKATVNMVRVESALYKACPAPNCMKKVIDQSNEMYRCEKCDKEYPNYKWRLLASTNASDWSDNMWITVFSEEAEKLLGIAAQSLGELQAADPDAYLDKFSEVTFKDFMFKLKVKLEVFNDEQRLRSTCMTVSPVDYKAHNEYLLGKIKEMEGITQS